MANITPKRNGELLKVVFTSLEEHPDGMQAKDVLSEVAKNVVLTDFEKGSYPSDLARRPRFEKITRFASIATVKAGWLVKGKGTWVVTDEGRKANQEYKDPEAFYRKAYEIYKKWANSQEPLDDAADTELEEPSASSALIAIEEAQEQAWSQVEEYLLDMDPYDFQELVGDLFTAMGYHVDWNAPPGRDKGIDLVVFNDPLGAEKPRIIVQVKHKTTQTVSSKDLREFLSVFGTEHVGIYVSSSGFTRDAEEEARGQENKMVTLLNLEKFFDLWVKNFDNLSPDAQKRFPLKPVYFLALG